ncbi:hypothetical protein OU798_23450 [Prolixibacteraceae bacterium Z1-6]|uniref:DNA-binding transcriptional activator of the SARP family n=1 Tax=Draconibacterium aestuarii TaxID=2998507 RepID=A0A9X3FDT1_9BACT|nr:hypothetical protein [Prolixibacteraceae bacterium Z1-6]
MKIRGILLLTFFNLFSLIGSTNDTRGLLFNSKEVGPENRTGIDITRKGEIQYNGSFTISFDISMRFLAERYGYIFQLKETKGKNKLDLICKIDQFFPDLFILHNKNETDLKIGLAPIHNEMTNKWYPFQLKVDAKSGLVEMKFDNIEVRDTINLPENSKLEWTFGVVNRYGFDNDEVPPMSIKNIKFQENNSLKYYWPLYRTNSQWTKDSVSGKKAQLIHPAWNINKHQRWQKLKNLEFSEFPQIAFNKESESIYFLIRGEGIEKYELNTDNLFHYNSIEGKPYYEDGQQVAFNRENKLVAYSFYKDRISVFDENLLRWNNKEDTIPPLPKYWHHNKMLHPVDSVLTIVCGYGFFQYYNLFQQYDYNKKVWKNLEMKGDEIYPRYLSSLGQSKTDKNRFYLFGGLGNKQGRQIFGREFYYDLYQIDCDSNHVTRLWESNDIPVLDFTPVNSMIVDDEAGCFYTLCFPHNKFSTYLQVLKGNFKNPDWEFLGDTIPYNFHDIKSFADLYYWETHHELLAITCNEKENEKGNFEVVLYSLNFPPVELDSDTSVICSENKTNPLFRLLLMLLVIVFFVLLLYFRRKSRQKPVDKKAGIVPAAENQRLVPFSEKGRILMFGGFQVFDRNSIDITYRFSPTLKELFLLLILHTVDGNKGITSKKIQEYLWPDKSDLNAKNNRGVNIKKLRQILEDIGDVKITYDGNYWKINHDDEVFCDIEFIKQQISREIDEFAMSGFDSMLSILSRGNLLVNMESDWLDQIKDDITGRILNRLEELCSLIEIKGNETILLKIADIIFTFDQVNETALEYKCRILNKQGKHSLALEVYNHYTKLYSRLYNEDFSMSFKDLVK